MSSESDKLNQLIQIGHDISSHKYYAVGTGTILFYDYLLTLADEVKYAWSGNQSWAFWLFIINRYFPMTYQLWQFALAASPQSQFSDKLCAKTAWFSSLMFIVCTLLAQVVLTLRIYAVTMKSIPIAITFATITVSQFVLGICMTVFVASGVEALPPIPLDAFKICIFYQHRSLEIASISISLLYDFLAFSLIIFMAATSEARGLKVPTILKAIAEDATRYFLVIFTSHFVLEMTLNLGRESIQLLPASGNVVYLPVMVSRIMLSLKKVADSQLRGWSLGEPSTNGRDFRSIKFFRPRADAHPEEDSIPLDAYPESQIVAREK